MINRRSQFQQHPDFHITSSTILASTLHITRLNTRNPVPPNPDTTTPGPGLRPGSDHQATPGNAGESPGPERSTNNPDRDNNPMDIPALSDLRQGENSPNNSGHMNSFSSLLLWILGGASSEGINSFLSMFRDVREQDSPAHENHEAQNVQ